MPDSRAGPSACIGESFHPVKESDNFSPSAILLITERIIRKTFCDAFLGSPDDGGFIGGSQRVFKRTDGRFRFRRSLVSPDEGRDLSAGALAVDVEFPVAVAFGDSLLMCPQYCVVEYVGFGNV